MKDHNCFIVQAQESNQGQFKYEPMVEEVVAMLLHMEIDGETMQYILERVGLEYQMLNQLVMSLDFGDVEYMWEERKGFQ